MPHLRQPPSDIPSILATSEPDPEWSAALENSPIPSGSDYGSDPVKGMSLIKQINKATYPRQRALLDASRPTAVTESEIYTTPRGNRVILCHPTISPERSSGSSSLSSLEETPSWPLIVLFHGDGHCFGNPEMELPLARLLVKRYDAIVILPSYGLAPESPFPASIRDCFETLCQIGSDIERRDRYSFEGRLADLEDEVQFLPVSLLLNIDVTSGFVVGGSSAGATIASCVAHHYEGFCACTPNLNIPHLTGLFLSCGLLVNPHRVPVQYESIYLSHQQNRECLPMDADFYDMAFKCWKPDFDSSHMPLLDRQPKSKGINPVDDHLWIKVWGVKVYLQACGMDMNRDDTLIYERMLREELHVQVRLDLYAGFGHCFWGMSGVYADLEMTKRRTEHTVEGIGALLSSRYAFG